MLGNRMYKYVRDANTMVSRVCLLIYICKSLAIPFFVDRPMGSRMERRPRLKHILKLFKIKRKFIKMGNHGGSSDKGTWLYSPFQWLDDLDLYIHDVRLDTSLEITRTDGT